MALAGRPRLDLMQEHDAPVVLGGRQMQVHGRILVRGKAGQLEVVRGKEREATALHQQVPRNRMGQRQAVEGGGSPADLVDQHQRAFGGRVDDDGCLGHLHHEGGAAAGQVVGSADAGEDPVDGAHFAGGGRHEAAAPGQNGNEGRLSHVGGLAAHIGAGDDQQPPLRRQLAVVGDELLHHAFHHRVSPALHEQPRHGQQARPTPARLPGHLGKGLAHIQVCQASSQPLQGRRMRGQLGQQLLVERPLARQRPLAGRQRLVLEGLQFRRDVAFGRFQRLAAPVLGGDAVGMTAAHLDVETMHAVVAHLQRGDAGTLALARLHLGQKAVAAGVDVAQLVELGIEAGADHAAVTNHRGRLVQQRGR